MATSMVNLHLSASEPMRVDTSPPFKMGFIRKAGVWKRHKTAGPEARLPSSSSSIAKNPHRS